MPKTVTTAGCFACLIAPTFITRTSGLHCRTTLAIASSVRVADCPASRATPDPLSLRHPQSCFMT